MHGGFALTWHAAERIPRAQCRQQVLADYSTLSTPKAVPDMAAGGDWWKLEATARGGKPSREDTHRTYMLVPTNNNVPAHQRNALFSAQ